MPTIFRRAFIAELPAASRPSQKTYNNNLGIIAGQNYIGEFVNNTGSTTTGVSNQAVPYFQGDARLVYRFRNGAFALFGETLYGKNNSLNEPPFGVAYLSVGYP